MDPGVLGPAIDRILSNNGKPVSEYLAGKTKNFQFLLGQAMRETKGKADPALLRQLLEEKLTDLSGDKTGDT